MLTQLLLQQPPQDSNKPLLLDFFAGGGGVSLGAKAAGFDTFGVELDPDIAEAHRRNLGECLCANVLDLKLNELPRPDWWHLSPPCQGHSVARPKHLPLREDTEITSKLLHFLDALLPKVVTIENVRGYAKSEGFKMFLTHLTHHGYQFSWSMMNAADFGVPQSRKRLIMIASREDMPQLPPPVTHNGWYRAIEDLLPTCADTKLTEAQKKAIEKRWGQNLLIETRNGRTKTSGYTAIPSANPSFTITTSHMPKAVLVGGQQKGANGLRETRTEQEISFCIPASISKGFPKTVITWDELIIKKLNIPCIARLQTFPDDYQWSGNNSLDGKIIGNSVPPLMMQKIAQAIREVL